MSRILRTQYRLHTLLALMATACVVLATWRESTAALGFVMAVIACVTAALVLRRRGYATGLRVCYAVLVGLIIGMLFVTTRDAHNRREELALLGAAALGGGLGGVLSAPREALTAESHPLDDPHDDWNEPADAAEQQAD